MTRCKNCKFWQRADWQGADERFGECTSDKFARGYNIRLDTLPDDGVIVENDEGWAFLTGREFGCVHGVAREVSA